MGQIGTLITGAGVVTTFSGLSIADEYLVVGAPSTANALRGITVEIDGTPFINVQNSAPLVGAYGKWMNEFAGAAGNVGIVFKLGTGQIKKPTTIRLTNDGATVPAIFTFSDSKNGVPFIVSTKAVLAGSYEDFDKFSCIILSDPANVSAVEIEFIDGHKETMPIVQVDALFSIKNQSEANGRLNACSVIDNTDQSIKNVRVYATGVNVTALVAKVPNQAFDAIVEAIETAQ